MQDGRSHLRSLLIPCCVDAGVSGDFPFPALIVLADPGVIGSADVANRVLRAVVGGDGAAGFFSGDVVHLNLNADGLLLHFFNLDSGLFVHNMYLPFGFAMCVFPFGSDIFALKAHIIKLITGHNVHNLSGWKLCILWRISPPRPPLLPPLQPPVLPSGRL